MRISDWSSDVCSSDLDLTSGSGQDLRPGGSTCAYRRCAVSLELQSCSDGELAALTLGGRQAAFAEIMHRHQSAIFRLVRGLVGNAEEALDLTQDRSEEHTSELQSLMRISYAVFCLKKKTH